MSHTSENTKKWFSLIQKNNLHEMEKMLINNEIDVEVRDEKGLSALMYAGRFNNVKMKKLLVKYIADNIGDIVTDKMFKREIFCEGREIEVTYVRTSIGLVETDF